MTELIMVLIGWPLMIVLLIGVMYLSARFLKWK